MAMQVVDETTNGQAEARKKHGTEQERRTRKRIPRRKAKG